MEPHGTKSIARFAHQVVVPVVVKVWVVVVDEGHKRLGEGEVARVVVVLFSHRQTSLRRIPVFSLFGDPPPPCDFGVALYVGTCDGGGMNGRMHTTTLKLGQ